jgi:hypothetical protein
MNEQAQQEQTPVDRGDALKAQRAGQTCIAVFVVFLVSLLSFGKAPISRVAGTDGSRVNFNLISCLGVAMGVFAFFFLLLRLKKKRGQESFLDGAALFACVLPRPP